jgi:hypothetical protein
MDGIEDTEKSLPRREEKEFLFSFLYLGFQDLDLGLEGGDGGGLGRGAAAEL